MKTAIVYYSYTGNTEVVAKKIYDYLIKSQSVDIIKLNATDEKKNPTLTTMPDMTGHHHIIIGSPVRGFQLPPVITSFILGLPHENITLSLFVTHYFKPDWLGGTQAINHFKKVLNKQYQIKNTGIISWRNKNKDAIIASLVELFSRGE